MCFFNMSNVLPWEPHVRKYLVDGITSPCSFHAVQMKIGITHDTRCIAMQDMFSTLSDKALASYCKILVEETASKLKKK